MHFKGKVWVAYTLQAFNSGWGNSTCDFHINMSVGINYEQGLYVKECYVFVPLLQWYI